MQVDTGCANSRVQHRWITFTNWIVLGSTEIRSMVQPHLSHLPPPTSQNELGCKSRLSDLASMHLDWLLTIDDDLNDPEVDLSPSHDAPLAGVIALVGLFYAVDLKMVVAEDLEAHWQRDTKTVSSVSWLS